MNCKNVEPLLSLYVSRDLDEERSRLVAAHLQSCKECTLAADEYAEASQLLRRYDPPFFSDEVYSGIRRQVLNEIKRESHRPIWSDILSQLLIQPRMRWITAALLLAISVAALFLSHNHSHELPNQVAVQAGRGTDDQSETGTSSLSNKEQGRVATTRRIIRKRKANAVVVATNRSRQLDKTAKTDVSQPSSAPAPLRLEMQTSDRNIRIIWLSGQRPPASGSDGSKGL